MARYVYDARHNTTKRVEDDTVIEDGGHVRVSMTMMDSMQRSVAVAMEDAPRQSATDRALYNLDVSNRWRGGIDAIEAGDVVTVGDQTRVVQSRDNGKLVLRDATSADGEAHKQEAYDSYVSDIQSPYMTRDGDAEEGDTCLLRGGVEGRWRNKGGKMVWVVGKSKPDEWEVAGPLSDSEMVQMKDQAYLAYDKAVSEAWKTSK